jgi:hypothetical protein
MEYGLRRHLELMGGRDMIKEKVVISDGLTMVHRRKGKVIAKKRVCNGKETNLLTIGGRIKCMFQTLFDWLVGRI